VTSTARSGDTPEGLHERLSAFVGLEAEPAIRGRDDVNLAMIRAWCDAIGDHNPSYLDPAWAERAHRGIVAPPSMVMCWFFPAIGTERPTAGSNLAKLTSVLRDGGYVSVVATNVAQTHHRYARLGESLLLSWSITAISPEKRTSLGRGFFLRTLGAVANQRDELICEIDYSRLYFKP
jgi:acyl dehydratase